MVLVFKKEENITLPTTIPKICEQYYRSGDHAYATEFQITHFCLEHRLQAFLNRKFCKPPKSPILTRLANLGEIA